jgi:hypothetical protein
MSPFNKSPIREIAMAYTFSITNWQDAFLLAVSNILTNVLSYLPTIFAALLVFVAGVVLAKWARRLTIKILEAIKLSAVVKKSGFEPFLDKAEIGIKAEEIFGGVVKWLIILVFFITAVNILGLTTVSLVLNNILGYVPRIISAVLVLTVGVLLAGLVESLVKGALAQIDLKTSRLLGKISSYLVVIFSILAAINELQVAQVLVNTLFMGFVGMLALGFGLAIGLGAKELVAEVLKEWYKNFKKEIKK